MITSCTYLASTQFSNIWGLTMLNETDLAEFYEWLDRKTAEAGQKPANENLIEQQLHHIRELIRIQQKMLGIKL